jgi:uncharacterized protein (DUF1800 family)
MSLRPKAVAAQALHRFGLGPRAGTIDAIASDPRGALRAELERPGVGLIANADLLSASQAATAAFNFRQQRQAREIAMRQEAEERAAAGAAGSDSSMAMEPKPDDAAAANAAAPQRPPEPDLPVELFRKEVKARLDSAMAAELGFVERLVWFWSNHFCISADVTQSMAGPFEREAIRAHVLGRFADMLQAVESHPAMLFYLDNTRSIGPKSVAGLIGRTGLNENLAREVLELHTLGVRSVYDQTDVTSFAKVLTGWTIIPATRRTATSSYSIRACTSRARSAWSARITPTWASSRAARCSPIWRATRRPPLMSRASSRATSSPTIHRARWSNGSAPASSTPTAISRRSPSS